jgi:triacylglycerol lipase
MLLHGYLATRGSLTVLERRLSQQGHVVFTCPLGPIHVGDIRTSAERVARRVESVLEQTGLTRLDLVGHSLGGLVGLYYLKRLGGHRHLRRLGLLGTPALGTWSALLGLLATPLGKGSAQLLPNSTFIEELSTDPLPPDVEVFSIVGNRDWLVPASATYLAGVRRICVPTNHAGLLFDDQVADSLGAILRGDDKGESRFSNPVSMRR